MLVQKQSCNEALWEKMVEGEGVLEKDNQEDIALKAHNQERDLV